MYLKSLEIQGFKSFPDKTVLQFDGEITAIVGPNGSGKSNVSDAICWVLGEQSSRALRGARMEDVIFGGTAKRPPLGYAQATLVLDNSDGTLAIDTPEVMVTRRYFRSGESEYYINKQSARLKDINELFMDTGLGREGYSNIGQGRIDEILSLKSTDRREIFEEAAGISKYRHRKEETERRLANTDENLLRIGDKISELELQVEPLREQAEKAQKYLRLREILKGLEVTIWLDGLKKAGENTKKAEQDYTSAAFILEQVRNDLNQLYTQSEHLSMQYNQQTLLLDRLREELSAMESQLQQKQADITLHRAEIDHQNQNIDRITQEISDQKNRSGGIDAQIQAEKDKIVQIQAEVDTLGQALQTQEADAARVSKTADGILQQLTTVTAQKNLLASQLADSKMQAAALQASSAEVLVRHKILQDELQAAEDRSVQLSEQRRLCRKNLDQAKDNVQSAANTIAGYELRLKTRKEKHAEYQQKWNTQSVQLDTLQSKIRMLQEMEREYEGFSKAVKLVMQDAERGALRGIHGPLSRLIQVDEEYTTAIETALGAAMQNIVVDSESDGKAAIQMLKRRDGGRATFLPISTIRSQKLTDDSIRNLPGFIGIASELVKTAPQYRAILENSLGKTVIADHLDHAIALAKHTQNRVRIVTLDGQVMNVGGSMTGGSTSRSSGILSRTNTLAQLTAQRDVLSGSLQALKKNLEEAASQVSKTEFEISAAQGELRQAEDEVLRQTEQVKQADALFRSVEESLDSIDAELRQIEARTGNDEGKLQMLLSQCESRQAAMEQLEAQEASYQKQLDSFHTKSSSLNDSIQEIRLSQAQKQAAVEAVRNTILQMETLRTDMQGDLSRKDALISEYRQNILREEAAVRELTESLHLFEQDMLTKKESLTAEIEVRTQLEAKRNKNDKLVQDKNGELIQIERETARLEQKKVAGEAEEKLLIDKLWESYELTPGTAEAHVVEIESLTAANKAVTDTRRKIAALGTPNLGAIEEYARVSERYQYLSEQRNDVRHAKAELETIVESITKEMTEIFVREFGKINTYFSQTFLEMFGGGKASLELEDVNAPLTCGIEIKVQPPGKQLKTITLLSGGEKAFVAIALYFSILKVRPTPFCMLDEIDAALDDRNVERFAKYLHSYSGNTQFIVITHRRGTMESADVLYGVTMQEQGVSKLLRLNLDMMASDMGITA